jgi:transketolase
MPAVSLRHEAAKQLVEIGGRVKDLVVMDADLIESTRSIQFQEVYPERYFNVGIAEQNMVGMAAGLALSGKIPVAYTFACFMSMRACEQVRTSVCYPNLNVKLFVSHGGLSPGTAASSHHATEDIAIMRAFPNMTVLVPGDAAETRQAVEAAIAHVGPVYLRLGAGDADDVYGPDDRFRIGKATQLRSGDDATIITTGYMVSEGVRASDELKKIGVNARVLQMACVKPLDKEAVVKAALETKGIVTVEEHTVLGGLGGAVCEAVCEVGGAKVLRLGLQDRFTGIGGLPYLLKAEGLTVEDIVKAVKEVVR